MTHVASPDDTAAAEAFRDGAVPTGAAASPELRETDAAPQESVRLTPAGLQSVAILRRRRLIVIALNVASLLALGYGVALALSVGGWSPIDGALLIAILLSAPWTLLGFWNSAIGLMVSRGARDPMAAAAPHWRDLDASEPLHLRTAIAMALRNEDPERAFARLRVLRRELDASGDGALFDLFILSDSDQPEIVAREQALFDRLKTELDGLGCATYRRREDNAGYKAGNIRDFLDRWGEGYALMLPLDADSMMSARAIRRMVRVMQRHPKLGILQSQTTGLPSTSPFARLFQFGMSTSAPCATLGAAWWQGDCGPFWGHNALVRIAPFKSRCALPKLPGEPPLGGWILSHDQLEAVLMRRAGYEVRVIPKPTESWEEFPVTLLDFIRRERRWCNGNLQYLSLLRMKGLHRLGRFQLLQAVLMYLAPPAWMAMMALAACKAFETEAVAVEPSLAIGLFLTMVGVSLAPKLIGVLDAALAPGGLRRFGGGARFAASAFAELLFGILLAPAVALAITVFMAGLPFGRRIGWNGQIRDAYGLGWRTALGALWPQTLFGLVIGAALLSAAPAALPWAAPALAGLLLAVPVAVLTASPALGRRLAAAKLAATPDEAASPPETLRALGFGAAH